MDNNKLIIVIPKEDCSICLEHIQNNNLIITHCNHIYHMNCLLLHLVKNNLCPLCRDELELKRTYNNNNNNININNNNNNINNNNNYISDYHPIYYSNYFLFVRIFDKYLASPFYILLLIKAIYDFYPITFNIITFIFFLYMFYILIYEIKQKYITYNI